MRPLTPSADSGPSMPEFDQPPAHPLPLAAAWLDAAIQHPILEAAAATLATADGMGRVTSRAIAVKAIDNKGAIFGSSLTSRKARDIAENPYGSLSFYWRPTIQQLLLHGRIEQLSDAESDSVWAGRARVAQAASTVAITGQPLASEAKLAEQATSLAAADGPIPRPAQWAAFRLIPDEVEFWHGRPSRLHRRLHYVQDDLGRWIATRLQP